MGNLKKATRRFPAVEPEQASRRGKARDFRWIWNSAEDRHSGDSNMRRWARYGNGFSRSVSAEEAEAHGRLPLTRAVDAVYERYDCRGRITRSLIRSFLEQNWDGEWHHVGRYAARVQYYNTILSFGDLRRLMGMKNEKRGRKAESRDRPVHV
jgi:hypothetical protein